MKCMPGTDSTSRTQKTAGGSCLSLQWCVHGNLEHRFNFHLSIALSVLLALGQNPQDPRQRHNTKITTEKNSSALNS